MTWIRFSNSMAAMTFLMLTIASQSIAMDKKNGWSIEGKNAIFRKQGKTTTVIPLRSQKGQQGKPYTVDEASILAGCLILNRGIKQVEGTDMRSDPESVRLFTSDGNEYKQSELDSQMLLGVRFEHPSKKWGIVLIEGGGAEGDMSSFTLVRNNCSTETHSFENLLLYSGGEALSDPSNPSLKIPGLQEESNPDTHQPGRSVSLIIHSDGKFEIRPQKPKS